MLAVLASIALVSVLSAGSAFGSAVGQGNPSSGPPVRFLVFTSGESAVNQSVRDAVDRAGGQTIDDIRVKRGLGFLVVGVTGEASPGLAGIPGVREVSREIAPQATDDPIPWGVDRVEAECVWGGAGDCESGVGTARSVHVAGTPTGAGVVVAITDTGVQLNHPDLSANTSDQPHADCTQDNLECTAGGADTQGHGTHVAGSVAATHNGTQVIGVGPGAGLLSVKCLDPSTFFSCLRAVRYAAGLDSDGNVVSSPRAQVVNMSWGWDKKLENQCPSCVATIDAIMEEAWSRGLFLVTSAGNEGNCRGKGDNVGFPARLDKPTAVAATNESDGSPCFSSTGGSLDLAAPGAGVLSTALGGGTTTKSGTSMAAPHVSGVAALVLSANDALSNTDVKAILLQTAHDLGGGKTTNTVCGGGQTHDTWHGCGLVRADLAVAAASANAAPSVTVVSPGAGATVSGSVTIQAGGTDDSDAAGTLSVGFAVTNAADAQVASGTMAWDGATGTYKGTWNTTDGAGNPLHPDGGYTVTVTATDSGSASGSDAVGVALDNVDDPPEVTITSPAGGEAASGTIDVAADATDDKGVSQVAFFVDGVPLAVDSTAPYAVSWETSAAGDGAHTLKATATDIVGQTADDSISVTVDNTAPAVSITNPTGGTVSGTITVEASASDATSGVAQVEFFVSDGTATTSLGVDTDGVDGWFVSWNTATIANGGYTLTATATDAAGNSATSAGVAMAVSNTVAATMHVGDLDGQGVKLQKGRWKALVTITVHRADETSLTGFTVTGTFTQNGWSESRFTCTDGDGDGQCTVDSGEFPNKNGKATFTVDDVTPATLTYEAVANHDPDGDSDGTTIELSK